MRPYQHPSTIQYKEKTFFCTYTYVEGRILYKLKLDPQSLYRQVQSGDALYQIYIRSGIKFVRKSDNFVIKSWILT